MLNGFSFNGKHSFLDFALVLNYFQIQPPAPKKIIADVPYMDGDGYDFSTVGTGGEPVYTGRDINCKVTIMGKDEEDVYFQYGNILEWLFSGKGQLIHDLMPDVYFMAEVREAPSFSKDNDTAEIEFKFRADPYKQGVSYVGNEEWDTFNFETDYLAASEFDISGSGTVIVYNPGRAITPTINVNAAMTATINGYTSNLAVGDNTDYLFKLQPGANTVQISGTGHIKFIFRKEAL